MADNTCTLTRKENGLYDLLIRDKKNRVILQRRDIPFEEAVYCIEMTMYVSGEDNGGTE